jgi:hypothetical protein
MFIYSDNIDRAVFGFRRFNDIRFSEKYVLVYVFPVQDTGIKLIIYNTAGAKVAEIGDDVQKGILGMVNFDWIEQGCGTFNFTLLGLPGVTIDYNYRVDIHLFGSATAWFSGYVMKKPKTGSTTRTYQYSGFGYYNQLETCIVDKEYFTVQPAQKNQNNKGPGSAESGGTPTASLALTNYKVEIDGAGDVGVATFKWSDDDGLTWEATTVATSASLITLNNGVKVKFTAAGKASNDFEVGDSWTFGAIDFDMEVANIVDDIITTFVEPKTNIVYDAAKIITTGYKATYVKFDKVTAKKALQDLADLAQNYTFGIDEEKDFYFKAISTAVNEDAIRFVAKSVKTFTYDEDVSKIVNKIYIRAGSITDGSNYIGFVESSPSQTSYGLKEKILVAPTVLNVDDATRWGTYKLNSVKDPILKGKASTLTLNKILIKAFGKARIFDENGNKYELPIKKVSYKVSSQGITCDMELGELDQSIQDEFLGLIRDLKNEELLQASNVVQLS